MKLAVVTGQIVCTVRHHGLAHDKLLMVEMIDPQGNPDGQCARSPLLPFVKQAKNTPEI